MEQQEQTSNQSVVKAGALIGQAWETVKANLGLLIGVVIIVMAIGFIPSVAQNFTDKAGVLFLIQIAGMILNLWISLGVIKIALNLVKNKPVTFNTLFQQGKYLLDFIVATIVYDLIILGGLILLIVPGIIWAIKFQFFPYFIVEKNLSPIEALKASSKITYGDKWNLLILGIVLGLLNLAGVLALGVGLLITYPITILAMAYAYIHLKSARFQTSAPSSSRTDS